MRPPTTLGPRSPPPGAPSRRGEGNNPAPPMLLWRTHSWRKRLTFLPLLKSSNFTDALKHTADCWHSCSFKSNKHAHIVNYVGLNPESFTNGTNTIQQSCPSQLYSVTRKSFRLLLWFDVKNTSKKLSVQIKFVILRQIGEIQLYILKTRGVMSSAWVNEA